ncbi:MAG TPA: mandelate racemase/muconate lactonizing enzyme family protein [Candidatus Latescibacteria bacterium]|nr:L-alanine-DL-glutamate epimerase [Gemmatimonadota bacterium]HCR16132.1 mandelate racemase/muconate lactonizing enzyme family protein [Candidatus Latescibacterota bacterium]
MKITKVEPILLTVDMPEEHPLRWSGGEAKSINCALVRIHTDEGISGLGDCYGSGFVAGEATAELFRLFGRFLEGHDPRNVSKCFETMYRRVIYWGRSGLAVAVASTVENALWDITGKAAGKPVHELIGRPCHDKLPIYASGGLEQPLDSLKAEMHDHISKGYKAVKMRIGVSLDHDLERVATCRAILGPDVKLMADAVMGHNPNPWTSAEAVRAARSLEEFDLFWLEEPCFAADYDGYAHVRQNTPIPISGGESSCMTYEFKHFFDRKALDIAQPDACQAGGILECLKIAALADANGVKVAPHAWGTSITVAANLAWAFVARNTVLAEYPTWHFPLTDELFIKKPCIEDGYVLPPTLPGLGVELTNDTVEKYRYRPDASRLNMRRASSDT